MSKSKSKNYEKVEGFYNAKIWSLRMVKNAVNRWITAAEYQEITGKEYVKG
ncbi:MAG: XkdX family protein [Paenibacillaceae bacterium]|nr:XkdX family protein [Paenibacillaceae bacterium]